MPDDNEVEATCECCSQTAGNCGCFICESCNHRAEFGCNIELCSDCSSCCSCCTTCESREYNCSCMTCRRCGYRSQSGCSECERCVDCGCTCSADDEDEEEDIQPGAPFIAKGKRLVGLEIEYNTAYRVTMSAFCSAWRAGLHSDCSCGWEIVTAPIAGDHIDKCLAALGRTFCAAEAEANDSCGIHCHVDARDLSWHDMYRLLHCYAKVEGLLYVLAGQQRVENQYCIPCGNQYAGALASVDRKGAILGVAYNSTNGKQYVKSYKPEKKNGGRYKGLNLCPWLYGRRSSTSRYVTHRRIKGNTTVEFRLHRNSLDMARVTGWAHLCAALVDYAAKASDAEAAALPKSPLRALIAIAPNSKAWIMHRVMAWRTATKPHTRRISVAKGWAIKCAD